MTSIWCLFSIDNLYDQPDNNLVAWWPEKPSINIIADVLGISIAVASDEDIVAIVKIFRGDMASVKYNPASSYRLRRIDKGVVLSLGEQKKN